MGGGKKNCKANLSEIYTKKINKPLYMPIEERKTFWRATHFFFPSHGGGGVVTHHITAVVGRNPGPVPL